MSGTFELGALRGEPSGSRPDLLADPVEIRDGRLAVSDRPGLGLRIDPDKLERYRVDRR